MSILWCETCDKMIDTDFDTHAEHFKEGTEEHDENQD